mmetsp:Transcript_17203/g.32573  ORF Transcript_17203/g.32573 Transcript_17203/m.32573 type:complete len:465 (+) Transcript_17203:148-1542(+)
MSPKRDSPPVDSKGLTPKHEPVSDNDSVAPNAGEAAMVTSLDIPPLPRSRRELFKLAHDTLPDEKMKSMPQVDHDAVQEASLDEDKSLVVSTSPDYLPRDVIGKYINMIIKLISSDGSIMFTFPIASRRLIDEWSGSFLTFNDFNSRIADLADGELTTRSFKSVFYRPDTHFGSKLNLCIVTFDEDCDECLLTASNYEDIIVSTFAVHGKLVFKLYSPEYIGKSNNPPVSMQTPSSRRADNYLKQDSHVRDAETSMNPSMSPTSKNKNKNEYNDMTDDEFFQADNLVRPDVSISDLMKRAGPPYGDAPKTTFVSGSYATHGQGSSPNQVPSYRQRSHFGNPPGLSRPFRQHISNLGTNNLPQANRSIGSNRHQSSPIRVYDDDECKVRNSAGIVPFSRESIADRIEHLEACASITLPRATDVAKLLKSHNVTMTNDEDHLVWYQRFGEFASMIGIYLCPPQCHG